MDFIDLIQTASTETIKDVIESKGIFIDSNWLDYESLNIALQSKRKDVAMLLLEKNCRVNKSTTTSDSILLTDTPLHHAVTLNDLDLVHHLLNKKASIVAINLKGNTPLHLAFMLKHEAIIDTLLAFIDETSTFVNSKNNQGLTHLHIACTRKNEDIIKKFLEAGANVKDTVSENSLLWAGFNALHFAANSKSLEAVRTLITTSDLDPKIENGNGKTPFRLAYEQLEDMLVMLDFLSKDSFERFSQEYSQFSYFHMTCLRNNPKDVENFIRKGVDANTLINCNSHAHPNCTSSFFAVESACDENIEILLKNGADVSQFNDEGTSPLHLAFYTKYLNRKEEIIDQIYSNFDKDLTYADENGLNLLHIACSRNDMNTVTKILNLGKKVNKIVSYKKRDFYRFTPLHFAVKYKHVEMADLLIKRGANVNANDDWAHGTPLHLAFAAGHKELIELLLKNGADPKAVQVYQKKTMLHYLVSENDDKKEELLEYAKYLLKNLNFDINAQDSLGHTPLHVACRNFKTSVKWVKLLLHFGADINLETKYGYLPFDLILKDLNSDYASDCMAMFHHIQKLKALRLPVHNKNEACCKKLVREIREWGLYAECLKNETLARMRQQRQDEIDKMKRVELTKGVSLHDFLLLDSKDLPVYTKNETLKKIVVNEDLMEYPSYACLIRLQYHKAIDLNN